jgi:putative membrane protein
MMTGMLGAAMWLMMGLMLLGLAAGGIAWVRRRLHPQGRSGPPRGDVNGDLNGDVTAEEVLRRRYAAGEIDREEYLRRQRDLTETDH